MDETLQIPTRHRPGAPRPARARTSLAQVIWVTIPWWSAAAGGLSYWSWEQWMPETGNETTLAELIGLGEGRSPEIWLYLGIGAVALLTLPAVVRAVAVLHGDTARAIVNGRAELRPPTP